MQPTAAEAQTRRRRYLSYVGTVLGVVLLVAVLIWIILQGYSADWTGFQAYTDPKGDFHPPKMLWDWMQLLIVPLALGAGLFLLNRSEQRRQAKIAALRAEVERKGAQAQAETERRLAEERAETERNLAHDLMQENSLQAYLDRMQDLLEKGLKSSPESGLLREVARTRTLTVLRSLDNQRNGILLDFLHDSELLTGTNPVVSLDNANLGKANLSRANLSKADLSKANLSEANLSRTNLSGTNLSQANLNGADLSEANLSKANLSGADMSGANLSEADLSEAYLGSRSFTSGANLTGANLSGANLSGAYLSGGTHTSGTNLSGANLSGAYLKFATLGSNVVNPSGAANLNGATYNDATEWPDDLDLVEAGVKRIEAIHQVN